MSERRLRGGESTNEAKVFLLSGFDKDEKKDIAKKISSLGGLFLDFQDYKTQCTHVICGKLSGSEKFLGACATGKWVLHPDYVRQSIVCQCWLDEEQFEWCDDRFAQETASIPQNIVLAPRRWRFILGSQRGAFEGWNVALIMGEDWTKILKRLLISGGAKVFNMKLPIKDPEKISATITYMFVSQHNFQSVSHLVEYGVLCVRPEFIKEYLVNDPPADPMDYLASMSETVTSGCVSSVAIESSPFVPLITSSDMTTPSSPDSDTKQTSKTNLSNGIKKSLQSEFVQTNADAKELKNAGDGKQPFHSYVKVKALNGKNVKKDEQISTGHSYLAQPVSPDLPDKHKTSEQQSNGIVNEIVEKGLLLERKLKNLYKFQPRTSKHLQGSGNVISTLCRGSALSEKKCDPFIDSTLPLVSHTQTPKRLSSAREATHVPHVELPTETLLTPNSRKRKGRNYEILYETHEYFKRQKLSRSELRPSMFPAVQVTEENLEKSSIFGNITTEVIHIYLDEGFPVRAVKETLRLTSVKFYPSPSTTSVIIRDIMLKSQQELETRICYTLLITLLKLHPPHTPRLKEMYLQMIQGAGTPPEESEPTGSAWGLLKDCIRCSINGHTCSGPGCIDACRVEDNHRLLLKFLVTLMEVDFKHCINSCRQAKIDGREFQPKNSLLLRVLWSPYYHVSLNNKCRQLLDLFTECLNLTSFKQGSVHSDTKVEVLQQILSLVSMVTEYCRLIETQEIDGSISSLQLPNTSAFVHEISRKISAASIQDISTLQLIMKLLHYPWLCVGVCVNLLGTLDDYLLAEDQLPDIDTLSLSTIVSSYFFLLPRLQKVKRDHETLESPSNRHRVTIKSTLPVRSLFEEKRDVRPRNVNKKNTKGETLLHVACMRNNVAKVKQLLSSPGVDINAVDNAGWTPLHEACNHGSTESVQELLKFVPAKTVDQFFNKDSSKVCRKVDLLAKNPDGITPLHDAVISERLEVCRLLLQHGGSRLLSAVTSLNYTPFDLASSDKMFSLLSSFLPSPKRRPSLDDSLSLSQDSLEELRTDMPEDHLYGKVLYTDTGQVFAEKTSLFMYIQTITRLVQSYIKVHHLIPIRERLTQVRNCSTLPTTTTKIETQQRISEEKETVLMASCSTSTSNLPSSQSDMSGQRRDYSVRNVSKDLRVMRNLSSHIMMFRLHLYKLSQPELHQTISAELEELRLSADFC